MMNMQMTTELITITNNNGMSVTINPVGASISSIVFPSKNNEPTHTVVGMKEAVAYGSTEYLDSGLRLGATIGPVAGRISRGGYALNDKRYQLENDVVLHSGVAGMDRMLWEIYSIDQDGDTPKVSLKVHLNAQENGFPGNVDVLAHFLLGQNNCLDLRYEVITDNTTIVNLTNHPYFNLNGVGNIRNHVLQIFSDEKVDLDDSLIPTGTVTELDKTSDYAVLKPLSHKNFKPLDDYFITPNLHQATLMAEDSGIQVDVYSNQPGLMVYTPIDLPRKFAYHSNIDVDYYPAICLEPMSYPDAVHHEHFPSIVLKQGEVYNLAIRYEYSHIN